MNRNIKVHHERPSSCLVRIVVLLQGLLTLLLLLSGLGYGFSVPKPIPLVLALAALSAAAVVGLIMRKWWALIPAVLLIIVLGFSSLLVIGVGLSWMPGVEVYLLVFLGFVMAVPTATIVLSLMTTGRQKIDKPD